MSVSTIPSLIRYDIRLFDLGHLKGEIYFEVSLI